MGLFISKFTDALGKPATSFLWEVCIPNAGNFVNLRAITTEVPGFTVGDISHFIRGKEYRFPGLVEYTHEWPVTFVEGVDAKVFDFLMGLKHQIEFDAEMTAPLDEIKRVVNLNLIDDTDDEATFPKVSSSLWGTFLKNYASIGPDLVSTATVHATERNWRTGNDIRRKNELTYKETENKNWLAIDLIGCYIKSMEPIQLDYSANTELFKVNVVFSFDEWKPGIRKLDISSVKASSKPRL